MNSKVSVLMSSYNGAKTIDRAIKSILNQTYKNFEFIICNDGSSDDTYDHLMYWNNKDNRIKIINNKHNLGLQRSLNKCISYSSGKYIARMDDDDISNKYRFQIQVDFLQRHLAITFIGSNVFLFDDKDGVYGCNNFIKYPTKWQLFKRDEFNHPSIMIRSNILKKIHGYSESRRFYRIEDHELWLRLYSLGYRGANIQKKLLKYNVNIHINKNKFYDYYNRFRLLVYYKKKLHINFKGYLYIILPLLKLLVPNVIRNKIYLFKYNRNRKDCNI